MGIVTIKLFTFITALFTQSLASLTCFHRLDYISDTTFLSSLHRGYVVYQYLFGSVLASSQQQLVLQQPHTLDFYGEGIQKNFVEILCRRKEPEQFQSCS